MKPKYSKLKTPIKMKTNILKRNFFRHSKDKINAMDAETFLTQQSIRNQLEKEQIENDQRRWHRMIF